MLKEGGEKPPPSLAPAIVPSIVSSAPLPAAPLPASPSSASMAASEGAGTAPVQRRREVDWSAWAPALVFNPPGAPQPAAALPAMQPAPPPAAPPAAPGVGTIQFRNASADLGANDRALLRRYAAQALQSGRSLRVVGHAGDRQPGLDELGQRFFNFDISWARAAAAAEEIERAGLPLQRIVVEARGDTEPAAQGAQSGDGAANRRVNVYLQ